MGLHIPVLSIDALQMNHQSRVVIGSRNANKENAFDLFVVGDDVQGCLNTRDRTDGSPASVYPISVHVGSC